MSAMLSDHWLYCGVLGSAVNEEGTAAGVEPASPRRYGAKHHLCRVTRKRSMNRIPDGNPLRLGGRDLVAQGDASYGGPSHGL